jgi:hypothetical protein
MPAFAGLCTHLLSYGPPGQLPNEGLLRNLECSAMVVAGAHLLPEGNTRNNSRRYLPRHNCCVGIASAML